MPVFPAIRPRVVGDCLLQTVNARDLHGFLEVGRDFSNWIKARLTKYQFVSGADFVTEQVSANSGENFGGRPSTEYHLAIGTAKELAMVENNDQGRAARRYFIECERRLQAGPSDRPARHPAAGESIAIRLRLVEHCRRAYGSLAAQRLWFALDLPVVPEMRRPPAQSEIPFDWPERSAGHA